MATNASEVQLTPEQQSGLLTQLANTPVNGVYGIDLNQGELNEGRPPKAIQGEDGNYYLNNEYLDEKGVWQTNPDFSTPVYFFHTPIEAGDARGIYAEYSEDFTTAKKQGNWYTKEQIESYWSGEGDHGMNMNVFREQHPDMTFDQYMSFVNENTQLYGQGLTPESNPDEFSALTDKYGIQTSFAGDTGHMYGWNGSNYEKTYHADKSVDVGRALWSTGLGVMSGGLLGPLIGGAAGSAAVGNAAAAGLASTASQLALTGSVDPRSVLASSVIAGVNPGGLVADKYVPGVDNRVLSDTYGQIVGGGTGQGFVNGLVAGGVNDAVSQLIVSGDLDLKTALQAGLLQGGMQSLQDAMYDADYYSQEKIAARIRAGNPGMSVEESMSLALNDPNLNRTNLGAIIGEGGLLPFIPEANLSPIINAYEGLDGMLGGFLPNIFDPKGPMSGYTADEIQQRSEFLGKEFDSTYYGTDLAEEMGWYTDSGNLTPAGVAAQNQYIKDNFNPNWAYFHGTTGLDEKYSWSPNDRGDTEIYGTAYQVTDEYGNPIYTTGTAYNQIPIFNPDGSIKTNSSGYPVGGYVSVTSPTNVNYTPDNGLIMYLDNAVLPSTSNLGFWDAVNIGINDGWTSYHNNDNGTTSLVDSTGNTTLVSTNDFVDNVDITGGGEDKSGTLVNTGDVSTGDVGTGNDNSGADIDTTVNTGNTGGPSVDDPNNDPNKGATGTSNTGTVDTGTGDTGTGDTGTGDTGTGNQETGNTGTGDTGTGDTGTGDTGSGTTNEIGGTGYYTALDGSQHPYTANGAVQLPNGLVIAEGAVNGALGLTELAGTTDDELSNGTNETVPDTSTVPDTLPDTGKLLAALKNNGLPPTWTALNPYTKITPYQSARTKVLEGMLSGMMGSPLGNMNGLNFGASKDPYQKIGKSLLEAGMKV